MPLRRYTCYKNTNDIGIYKIISAVFWLEILGKLLKNYINIGLVLLPMWRLGDGGGGSPALIKTKTQSFPEETMIVRKYSFFMIL